MRTSVCVALVVCFGCSGAAPAEPATSSGVAGSAGAASGGAGTSGGGAAGTGGAAGGGGASSAAAGANGVEVVQQALSGSRLKAYWYIAADGAKQFAGTWFDSTLKIDCSMTPAPDGKVRCMPATAYVIGYFSDSGCSMPIAAVLAQICGNGPLPPTPTIVRTTDVNACVVLRDLGPSFSGQIFTGTPAACTAVAKPIASYSFFQVGPSTDLSKYQEAPLAHD
jgi:hypothetical protein